MCSRNIANTNTFLCILGAFTNQIQAAFREPRLIVVADPRADHQPVTEGSYANIPVIAFANVDSPTKHIDVAIPCNNKSPHSIGLMFWLLAREVLRMRGSISREIPWEVMPDLFFYRDPEEAEKEELARQETLAQAAQAAQPAKEENWGEGVDAATDWANEPPAGAAAGQAAPAAAAAAAAPKFQVNEDWANQGTSDWAAEPAAPAAGQAPVADAAQWGGSSTNWN